MVVMWNKQIAEGYYELFQGSGRKLDNIIAIADGKYQIAARKYNQRE